MNSSKLHFDKLEHIQVAEVLINPFGDDDDDFDCNHIVDSNYERSRAIVMDEQEEQEFKEKEEEEGEEELPETLPHTLQSYQHLEVALVLAPAHLHHLSLPRHLWFCPQMGWWWARGRRGGVSCL